MINLCVPLMFVVYLPAFPFLKLLIYVQIYYIIAICQPQDSWEHIHWINKICYHVCRI